MTNESFSPPSEVPGTPHEIANCDPLLCAADDARRTQREILLGVLIRRKGEERLHPVNSEEVIPALKALQTAHCPFKKLPEKRTSRWESR